MRTVVIGKALEILSRIHEAFTSPVNDDEELQQAHCQAEDAALEDAKRRRMLHALLDLISLEGIYPSLSSGVGIPLQQRVISVLPAGVIARQSQTPLSEKSCDEPLLDCVLLTLSTIILDPRSSIQPVIRGRILSDIISGALDLACNSKAVSSERKNYYQNVASRVIEEYVSVVDLWGVYTEKPQNLKLSLVVNAVYLPSTVRNCSVVQSKNLQLHLTNPFAGGRSIADYSLHHISIRPVVGSRSARSSINWATFYGTGYYACLTNSFFCASGHGSSRLFFHDCSSVVNFA